jgi:hypothetical protein
MTRLAAWLAALAGALIVAVIVSQPPSPVAADAPADTFSAHRAYVDVQAIAQAPHPTGSGENARVRAYLTARLAAIGLTVSDQPVPLSAKGRDRLRAWGEPGAEAARPVNIVGVLPGLDRTVPAVALMAQYDTVAGSPGAADDGAGVAAILEIARSLRADAPLQRDVVVVLTDAEELDLDGARGFFASHPLAPRIGAVINLEARGGAGRALMFEAGRDNGALMTLFGRAVDRPSAQSLTVFIYRLMPNSSDFTLARERGLAGANFAFMGGAGLYHSPAATPETLDLGSLQHLGAQALDLTRALARAPRIPPPAPDAVFADGLGLRLVIYPAWAGWAFPGLSMALMVLAGWRARRASVLAWRTMPAGAVRMLSLVLHAVLALHLANLISGSGGDYYDRLAALPRLELQAGALCLAVLGLALGVQTASLRWLGAVPALVMTGAVLALGGPSVAFAGIGVLAAATALVGARPAADGLGGWLGAMSLVLVVTAGVQAAAPTAAPLLAWPLLAASAAAAAAALIDPTLRAGRALVPVVLAAIIAGAQGLAMAHLAFLGVGADLPEAMAVFAALLAMLLWPLAPTAAGPRTMALIAALGVMGLGLAVSVRVDPPADTVPTYSR